MRVFCFALIMSICSANAIAGSSYGHIAFPDGSKLYIVQSEKYTLRSYLTKVDAKGKVQGESCMREDMSAMQVRRASMIAKARFVRSEVPAKYRRCL